MPVIITPPAPGTPEHAPLAALAALVRRTVERFVGLPPDEVDAEVERALGDLANALGAQRADVSQWSPDRTTWSTTHEWAAPGLARVAPYQQDQPAGVWVWLEDALQRDEIVQMYDPSDYPPGTEALREAARAAGYLSFLRAPLRGRAWALAGSLGIATHGVQRAWTPTEIAAMRAVAYTLGSAIEHRRAVVALAASEQRARAAFDVALGLVAVLSPDGVVLDVGQHAAEWTGAPRERLVGLPLGAAPWWGADAATREGLEETLAAARGGREGRLEASVRGPDGAARVLDAALKPALGRRGELEFIVFEGRDVTERVAAARAAERHAAFDELVIRMLSRFVQDATSALDGSVTEALGEIARFVEADHAFLITIAPDRARWIVRHEWVGPAAGRLRRHMRNIPMGLFPEAERILLAGEAIALRSLGDHPDGREALDAAGILAGTASFVEVPFRDGGGRVAGALALRTVERPMDWDEADLRRLAVVGSAIATALERRRAEDARMRLAAAVEHAADEVLVTDLDGAISYVNPAVERSSGWTAAELLGNNPRIFKSGWHPERFYVELWDAVRAGRPWSGRVINACKDGRWVTHEMSVARFCDAAGVPAGYVASRRDVTTQLALEERLAQSQKLEALGTLAGGVAHEFNNILGAVLGYVDLALAGLAQGADVREDLEIVRDGAVRATRLARQILTFGRRSTASRERLALRDVVTEAVELLRRTLPGSVRIATALETAGLIRGDVAQLQQVVVNLATNAALALGERGGVFSIGLEEREADAAFAARNPPLSPGPHVVLTVTDDGCGMAPEVLARVFDPFFTTRPEGEGTGLGLSVVHGVVAASRGAVTVESELGRGSVFAVWLPADVQEEREEDVVTLRQEGLRGHERVLFVDDEEAIGRAMKRGLEGLGYEVALFASAEEALRAFVAAPDDFDVVVTDLSMPGLSGLGLAEALRRTGSDLPILLATGDVGRIPALRVAALGGLAVLEKPYDIAALTRKIRSTRPPG